MTSPSKKGQLLGGNTTGMHVLLFEDNKLNQTESLHSCLEEQGHHVWLVHTPELATQTTAAYWPNIVVFHFAEGYSDLEGFQQAINKTKLNIPLIVVSDKNHLQHGINNDIILVAPNKPKQLDQGIQKATAKQKNRFLRLPDFIIDCQQLNILRNGKIYSLTPKEFKLLHLLIQNQNQVLSRKTIMQKVWETDYMGDTRTLDVHIRWIREKTEKNPSKPQHLITIRGVGYRFITGADSE